MSGALRPSGWLRLGATVGVVLVGSAGLLLASCSSDDSGDGPNPSSSFDSSGAPPPQSSGNGSSFGSSGDVTPDAEVPVCVQKEAEAVEGKRPLDIIFVIDNSESMDEEIAEVESQINTNFVNIIAASGVDYHVVMISAHGRHQPDAVDQRICVKAPLSATSCSPIPDKPAETASFIHYSTIVESTDAWCKVLGTFNGPLDNMGSHAQGWKSFLRPNAFKVFVVITDDRVNTSCNGFTFDDKNNDPVSAASAASTFESVLFGLSPQFGSAGRRNYIWHSIVAVAPFDPSDTTKPYPPTAEIKQEKCATDVNLAPSAGLGYQALSKLTGGLRYPTCGLEYTPIFKAMAEDAINRTVLACDYAMPSNPAGGTIDPATAVVRYTSGVVVTDFEQVPAAAECGPNKFYIENGRIKLCNEPCDVIQADQNADVKILFGCLPKGTEK